MEFGYLADISGVNFSLPSDHGQNRLHLPGPLFAASAQVFVGCPVWANSAWRGSLYPARAAERDYLQHYARQFNCIELNSTHYHVPDEKALLRWVAQTGAQFRFCPKVPQEISHHQLARGNGVVAMAQFIERMRMLGERLGVCWLQLSPQFGPNHFYHLHHFLSHCAAVPLAIEFRHPGWFREGRLESRVLDLLGQYGIGTVLTDVAGRRDVLHMCLTNSVATIRFVGNQLDETDYQRLDAWVRRLGDWLAQGLQRVYFFIHQPDNAQAPETAEYFIQQLNERLGLGLALPQWQRQAVQASLF